MPFLFFSAILYKYAIIISIYINKGAFYGVRTFILFIQWRQYLYLEWVFPQCWRYTLYNTNGTALDGNDVNLYEISSYEAAELALKQMHIDDVYIQETSLSIQDLIS